MAEMVAIEGRPTPVEKPRATHLRGDPKACGAKTRAGGQCQQPAMPNGKCKMHGGKTPSGTLSPNYKHGAYSKITRALPSYLQEGAEDAIADYAGLVDISPALAAQWSTIEDLYNRLPSGEAGETWNALRTHAAAYAEALSVSNNPATDPRRRDDAKANAYLALDAMLDLITEGAQEWQQRREIGGELDRLTVMAGMESKRRGQAIDLQMAHVAAALLQMIQGVVRNEALPVEYRQRLQTDLSTLINRASGKR